MKKLLLLLLLTPTLALCDVYRFYVLQHDASVGEEFSKLSGAELLALSYSGKITIHSFAELETKEGGTGSFDSLREIEVIESMHPNGSIKSKGKKTIGTEFTIKEGKGGVAAYTFKDTRLVRWLPLSEKVDALYPIINTVRTSNQVSIKFNSIISTGNHTLDGLTTIYLLERTASQ